MSNEQPGRTARQNTPGSPVGSTIAIVVTIVAVVLGFFILRQIRDDSDAGGGGQTTATSTTEAAVTSSSDAAPVTTEPQLTKTGTLVQVANASVQDGVAGQLTTALEGEGFDMAEATNAVIKLDATKVLYDESIPVAKAVADSVALTIGGAIVEVLTIPPPTADGVMPEGAGVLVLLGNDKAGKTLAQMNGETVSTDTTPASTP